MCRQFLNLGGVQFIAIYILIVCNHADAQRQHISLGMRVTSTSSAAALPEMAGGGCFGGVCVPSVKCKAKQSASFSSSSSSTVVTAIGVLDASNQCDVGGQICCRHSDIQSSCGTKSFESAIPSLMRVHKTDIDRFKQINDQIGAGVLVSDRIIVTAAHILEQLSPTNVTVSVNGLVKYAVAKIVIHYEYQPLQFYNDIGLLVLAKSLHEKVAIPMCLPAGDVHRPTASDQSTDCRVSGVRKDGRKLFGDTLFDSVTVAESHNCGIELLKHGIWNTNAICVNDNSLNSTLCRYSPYAGAPLLCITSSSVSELVGIASWKIATFDNSISKMFAVYTNVYSYKTWIEMYIESV